MREAGINNQLRRARRNYSDLEPKYSYLKNLQEVLEQQKALRSKLTSIKINRNKLPADFFPRSQSVRKKVSCNRPSLQSGINLYGQFGAKASSQQNNMSPEKTSFFGFMEQSRNATPLQGNTLHLKRQFQSRNQPKRQKIYLEHRNFTPATRAQRNDILLMFPQNYDQVISDAFKLSKKNKRRQIAAKEHDLRAKQVEKFMRLENPENEEGKVENVKEINMSTSGGSEDMHNITFYNAKSTSFPPINKNHNS